MVIEIETSAAQLLDDKRKRLPHCCDSRSFMKLLNFVNLSLYIGGMQ